MSEPVARKPFVQRASFDTSGLVGARWWQEGLVVAADPVTRRSALRTLAIAGGVVAGAGLVFGGIATIFGGRRRSGGDDPSGGFDEASITRNALDLQKEQGWNAGAAGQALEFPGAAAADVAGAAVDPAALPDLVAALRPAQPALVPYYVPTLFQTVGDPRNRDLRRLLRPVHDASTAVVFDQALATLTLFEAAGFPADTAIVADLPGPESVAFAAGLASRFEPVFAFDNWPHPKGVVASHLTLGAAVAYLPALRDAAAKRKAPAPPVIVLDRNRLASYTDDAGRFDNRYLAKIPPPDGWKPLGVKHVLYVVPAGAKVVELDDLNDDFVALREAGVDVKILSLADFGRTEKPAEKPKEGPDPKPEPGAPARAAEEDRHGHAPGHVHHHYCYGGHPFTHWWFWHNYGWHGTSPGYRYQAPAVHSGGAAFVPTPRRTLFSGGLAPAIVPGARSKPRGFGTVTYRTPRPASSGSSGRSGSFGRTTTSGGG